MSAPLPLVNVELNFSSVSRDRFISPMFLNGVSTTEGRVIMNGRDSFGFGAMLEEGNKSKAKDDACRRTLFGNSSMNSSVFLSVLFRTSMAIPDGSKRHMLDNDRIPKHIRQRLNEECDQAKHLFSTTWINEIAISNCELYDVSNETTFGVSKALSETLELARMYRTHCDSIVVYFSRLNSKGVLSNVGPYQMYFSSKITDDTKITLLHASMDRKAHYEVMLNHPSMWLMMMDTNLRYRPVSREAISYARDDVVSTLEFYDRYGSERDIPPDEISSFLGEQTAMLLKMSHSITLSFSGKLNATSQMMIGSVVAIKFDFRQALLVSKTVHNSLHLKRQEKRNSFKSRNHLSIYDLWTNTSQFESDEKRTTVKYKVLNELTVFGNDNGWEVPSLLLGKPLQRYVPLKQLRKSIVLFKHALYLPNEMVELIDSYLRFRKSRIDNVLYGNLKRSVYGKPASSDVVASSYYDEFGKVCVNDIVSQFKSLALDGEKAPLIILINQMNYPSLE
jgi:hypothetical protein